MRVGVIGCGFFATNHLHAWMGLEGADLSAICDNNTENLERAKNIVGPNVKLFSCASEMLNSGLIDFVDIVTPPKSHHEMICLSAKAGLPAIVQKPLAPKISDAFDAVKRMSEMGLPLMVHENLRFQAPIRQIIDHVRNGAIGRPTYARIAFRTGWDIYDGQPYLAEAKRFVLYDAGVHVVDVARAILGEVTRVSCESSSIREGIAGEDSATLLLRHENMAMSVVECSYASPIPDDPFPQVLVSVEGTDGAITLDKEYNISMRSQGEVSQWNAKPPAAEWMERPWDVVQDSVVNTHQHWLECLRDNHEPETSGRDNLNTLRIIEAAYQAAEVGRIVINSADTAHASNDLPN